MRLGPGAIAPLMLVAAVGLTGCGSTIQNTFGMGKRSPDEFQVVRRAPLVIPPDYALRPPAPGEAGPREPSTAEQARQVLTGQRAEATPASQSPIERELVSSTGIEAEPGIRATILEETSQLASVSDRTYLFILDFQRQRMEREQAPAGQVLDPVAESRRLREEGRVTTRRTGGTFEGGTAGQGS